jgi:hypothetical protein
MAYAKNDTPVEYIIIIISLHFLNECFGPEIVHGTGT